MEEMRIGDLLAIAEQALPMARAQLLGTTDLKLAESALAAPFSGIAGVEFHPTPGEKAGVLAARIVRNHPFRDGNKRMGLLAMRMFISSNGLEWLAPDGGQTETATTFERLAASEIREDDFVAWVAAHVHGRVHHLRGSA